jgi:hypothetical protein
MSLAPERLALAGGLKNFRVERRQREALRLQRSAAPAHSPVQARVAVAGEVDELQDGIEGDIKA